MNRIGRYEVERRIGSGGFATVYLVRDATLDSTVAAKVLAENWTDSNDLRERFIREAQILRRIDSNRVVTVHDIGELDSGQPYFVMSLATAGTLEDRITVPDAVPTPEDVQKLSREVAECIRAVHHHDLIHRDIKPSNLLITGGPGGPHRPGTPLIRPGERLLLGDFGLAKDTALQATGMTIAAGTGGYAAPEQMTPTGSPDRQTDLYAATAVLYRVISGTNPPNFDLVGEQVPFPDHGWWMKGRLGQFFRRGMSFAQGGRHQSVDQWLDDFEQAYTGGQRTVVPTVAAPPGTPGSDPATGVPAVPPAATPRPAAPPVNQPAASAFPSVPSGPAPLPPSATPPQTAPISAESDPTSLLPRYDPRTAQQPGAPGAAAPSAPYRQPAPNPYHPGSPNHGRSAVGHGGPPTTPQSGWAPPHSPGPGGPQPHVGAPYQTPVTSGPATSGPAVASSQAGRSRGRSWLMWLLATVVLAGLAAGGAFIGLNLLERPAITGPEQVAAGDSATFTASFEGAETFRWTFNGQTTEGPDLTVSGLVPGPITVRVRAVTDGELSRAATATTQIVASDRAPRIIGDAEIPVGSSAVYRFEAPEGAVDPQWREGGRVTEAESIRIEASGAGPYELILIVTLDDGTRIGTRRTIQLVG